LTGGTDVTLTCAEKSYILLRMSPRHASARAAIELALIGVTPLCVADILCR
jgi:hypothetical protein